MIERLLSAPNPKENPTPRPQGLDVITPSHTPDSPDRTWVTNSALIWDTVGATIFLG